MELMGTMLRSIAFIKSLHMAIFIVLSVLLTLFLHEVIVDKISALTWIAVALFLIEGVVLVVNRWKCPLTTYAERLGAPHGQVSDVFLPKWIADRVFQIYGGLFALGLVLLAYRVLS